MQDLQLQNNSKILDEMLNTTKKRSANLWICLKHLLTSMWGLNVFHMYTYNSSNEKKIG